MASETITRNDLTAILNEVLPPNIAGIVPDYGSAVSITSLPYTAPSFGIVIYTIGDGTNSGERNLTVNGVEIARARGISGETTTVTALVSAGDIVSGALGIWGTMRFVPYSLTMANRVLPTAIETFTPTLNVTATTYKSRCFYDAATGRVFVGVSIFNTSATWDQNTAFVTIPEKYRPKANLDVPAVILGNGDYATAPFFVTMYTDGGVKQSFTGAMRGVYFTAEYYI